MYLFSFVLKLLINLFIFIQIYYFHNKTHKTGITDNSSSLYEGDSSNGSQSTYSGAYPEQRRNIWQAGKRGPGGGMLIAGPKHDRTTTSCANPSSIRPVFVKEKSDVCKFNIVLILY